MYIRNLNEKIGIVHLKNSLKTLFKDAGFSVVAIQACKNIRLKGQAFVSFGPDVEVQQVLDQLNTKLIFGKPMHMQVARANSDTVVQPTLGADDYANYLKKAQTERLRKRHEGRVTSKKRRQEESADAEGQEGPTQKRARNAKTEVVPNKLMLLTNLPVDTTQEELIDLFRLYTGFLTVNYVSVRRLALIEFGSEPDAVACYEKLGANPTIKDKSDCVLAFAKK